MEAKPYQVGYVAPKTHPSYAIGVVKRRISTVKGKGRSHTVVAKGFQQGFERSKEHINSTYLISRVYPCLPLLILA